MFGAKTLSARMNVKPGCKQPKMRSTKWGPSEQVQHLVFRKTTIINDVSYPRGTPKGLRQIAKERRVRGFEKMKKDELIEALNKFEDLQMENIKTMLVEKADELNDRYFDGEQCIEVKYLPRFHCELAESELEWRNGKQYFRRHNDRQKNILVKRLNEALDRIPPSYFAKVFRYKITLSKCIPPK